MKKKFTSIALALVAALGIGAFAQTAAPATCDGRKAPRCEKQRPDRPCRDSMEMAVFFEGITLTPEQQTKIQTLRNACKQERKDRMTQARQERTDRKKAAADRQRQRLAEMKQILTPEQYVVYLENIVVNRPAGDNMHGRHAMKHGMKPGARAGRDFKAGGERPAKARPESR